MTSTLWPRPLSLLRSSLAAPQSGGRRLPRCGRVPHRALPALVLRGAAEDVPVELRAQLQAVAVAPGAGRDGRHLAHAAEAAARIKEFRPDAIVSVYPLASLVLGRMRRKKLLRVPVLTYLTDFAVHSLWVHRGIDRHLAVSEISAAAADPRAARTPTLGPSSATGSASPSTTARRCAAASASTPTTVPCSWSRARGVSAMSSPPWRRSGSRASSTPSRCVGATRSSRAELDERGFGTVIGWTDQMPALMTASDTLVENAGGLTCMEAFAAGLPVITYLPDRGARQGERRAHGARGRQPLRAQRAGAARHPALGHPRRPRASADDRRRPRAVRRRSRRRRRGAGRGEAPRRPQGSHGSVPRPAGKRVADRLAAAPSWCSTPGSPWGSQAASAIGVGVAKPPKGVSGTVYVGVRLDDRAARRPRSSAGSTSSTPRSSSTRSREGTTGTASILAKQGVDVANGGWGPGHAAALEPAPRRTSTRPVS